MKLPVACLALVGMLGLLNACHRPSPQQPQSYDPVHRCGGLAKHWFNARNSPVPELIVINEIQIVGDEKLLWNERPISAPTLRNYASVVSTMEPRPWLELRVHDGSSCELVKMVRQTLAKNCSQGTCIEFSDKEWANYRAPPPPCDADCQAYGKAGGSFKGLSEEQKARLKRNYLDKYGLIPW